MTVQTEAKEKVVIKFAGDSGDGMQLTGSQFTSNTAILGNDIATFPDYPAEIRAPAGTLAGVSGFQVHFGSTDIYTPGDRCDVLVAMNAAALKVNLNNIKHAAVIIVNTAGFDSKNLRLAGYEQNPLEDDTLYAHRVIKIDITKLTRESLADTKLSMKQKDRSKNMFVLGFLFWMYNRSLDSTIRFLNQKFAKKPDILDANVKVLKAGYHFGDTTREFSTRYNIEPAKLEAGKYRSIMGNEATAMGLIAASCKSGLPVFLGSYPITPASDILHFLSRYKNFGVRTFQAEDEIASVSAAIGAAFGGHLGVTTTSGPGMALKGEAIGLAVMLELPLVICNIQRAGPSTGMPTKTEQSDLYQALYGRNGESPMPVVAAHSPSDAFHSIFEACRIAIEFMTPVIFLSDGYIANGAEPWKFPKASVIPEINVNFVREWNEENGAFHPYLRDDKLSRPWAVPGTKGLEHRIGGLEKEHITGNVSYDPQNHEYMVKLRQQKVENIRDFIAPLKIEEGPESGDLLILGWGSTFGSIKQSVRELLDEGFSVSHAHLKYLNPFPANLEKTLRNFKRVLVPEINNGQLVHILRGRYLMDIQGYQKIQGLPITTRELKETIRTLFSE